MYHEDSGKLEVDNATDNIMFCKPNGDLFLIEGRTPVYKLRLLHISYTWKLFGIFGGNWS